MKINPNDPAFPFVEPSSECNTNTGLTIRAELAARAMQGLLAADAKYNGKTDDRNALIKDAIAFANALIAELNKPMSKEKEIIQELNEVKQRLNTLEKLVFSPSSIEPTFVNQSPNQMAPRYGDGDLMSDQTRKMFCIACNNMKHGVFTRISTPHTCGI